MKNLKSIALALVVVLSTLSATGQTIKIDVSKSSINWLAKKVTGQHNGTINIKDGALVFKKGKLKGGIFTVDMTSLTATDLTGKYLGELNVHLKSEDFFGVEKFPTSTLVFKNSTFLCSLSFTPSSIYLTSFKFHIAQMASFQSLVAQLAE